MIKSILQNVLNTMKGQYSVISIYTPPFTVKYNGHLTKAIVHFCDDVYMFILKKGKHVPTISTIVPVDIAKIEGVNFDEMMDAVNEAIKDLQKERRKLCA